jgi:hypothetical protein
MALFLPYTVTVNSQLVARARRIDRSNPDNGSMVSTIVGGVEGKAPGAKQSTVTIEEVVPAGGASFNWETRWKQDSVVDILVQHISSPEKVEGKLLVTSVESSSTVGEPLAKTITLQSIGDVPIEE